MFKDVKKPRWRWHPNYLDKKDRSVIGNYRTSPLGHSCEEYGFFAYYYHGVDPERDKCGLCGAIVPPHLLLKFRMFLLKQKGELNNVE